MEGSFWQFHVPLLLHPIIAIKQSERFLDWLGRAYYTYLAGPGAIMCHCYYTKFFKYQKSIRCIEFIPALFHPFSSPTVTSHTLQLSSTIHASGRMVVVVGLGWVLTWSLLIVTWFQWKRYWLIEKTCLTWKLSWGNWAAFSLNLLLKYYDGLDDWDPSTQNLSWRLS